MVLGPLYNKAGLVGLFLGFLLHGAKYSFSLIDVIVFVDIIFALKFGDMTSINVHTIQYP